MSRQVYQEFKDQFPMMTKDIRFYKPIGDWAVEIHYHNGSIGLYESALHSFRYIPNGGYKDMTEERWRMELGHKIYCTMVEKGLTMIELSTISGVSYEALSRYVNGHRTPNSYTLRRIAQGLGVEVGYLTDFERFYQ